MENMMLSFGELLRRLRGERSQREVAEELGMPATTLSSLENQQDTPRGPVLHKIAEYYGVPVTYFFPSNSSGPHSSESAKHYLLGLKDRVGTKETVATHASDDLTDADKERVAELINKRKRA
jgi:putative transcriptional regulator